MEEKQNGDGMATTDVIKLLMPAIHVRRPTICERAVVACVRGGTNMALSQ